MIVSLVSSSRFSWRKGLQRLGNPLAADLLQNRVVVRHCYTGHVQYIAWPQTRAPLRPEESGCWIWIAAENAWGYGSISVKDKARSLTA
jgi:hypothetical protein